MGHRSDSKHAALLANTGNVSGLIDDLEEEWLETQTGLSGSVHDLWMLVFLANGATSEDFNDAAYEFLVANGATAAALPDMWDEWWDVLNGALNAIVDRDGNVIVDRDGNVIVQGPRPLPTAWEYASLAIAESSGDPWLDGEQVTITGGAAFFYFDVLAVNGHSGLIHQDPFDESGVTSTVIVRTANGPGTDPDAWTGTSDIGIGTKTTDYDYFSASGESRLAKLTTAGKAHLGNSTGGLSTDTTIFSIIRGLRHTNTQANSTRANVQAIAYRDGSNQDWGQLVIDDVSHATNWSLFDTGYVDTGIPYATASDIFMYVKQGRCTVWLSDAATPAYAGAGRAVVGVAAWQWLINAGWQGVAGTADTFMKSFLTGKLNT